MSEVRAAWIAAAAGIVGALVGVLGSSVPAMLQAQAQEEQSKVEFLREQRQVAYSSVLTEFNDLEELFHGGRIVTDKELIPASEELESAVDAALLVAPADTRSALTQFRFQITEWGYLEFTAQGSVHNEKTDAAHEAEVTMRGGFAEVERLIRRDFGIEE